MTTLLTTVAASLYLATHPGDPALLQARPAAQNVAATKTELTGGAAIDRWYNSWRYQEVRNAKELCLKAHPAATPTDTTRQRSTAAPVAVHPAASAKPSAGALATDSAKTNGAVVRQEVNVLDLFPALKALQTPVCATNPKCGGACVLGVAGVSGQQPGVAVTGLPDDVLAALGVRVENYVAYYQHNVKGLGWIDIAQGRNGAERVSSVSVSTDYKADGGARLKLYPWFVSDARGHIQTRYRLDGEDDHKMEPAYFNQVINRLAPISIQTGLQPADVVVFWYEITPELLQVLPQATAQDLHCSYQKWLTPGTCAPGQTKCPAPAPSRLADAAVSLYPNPAKGSFNLDLKLVQDFHLKVRLLDMSGREIVALPNADVKGQGDLHLSFPLDGVPPGIYLVQLETPGGEHWSRRLIVEK